MRGRKIQCFLSDGLPIPKPKEIMELFHVDFGYVCLNAVKTLHFRCPTDEDENVQKFCDKLGCFGKVGPVKTRPTSVHYKWRNFRFAHLFRWKRIANLRIPRAAVTKKIGQFDSKIYALASITVLQVIKIELVLC